MGNVSGTSPGHIQAHLRLAHTMFCGAESKTRGLISYLL